MPPRAGPTGKVLLLPADPATDVVMVATGSGIAPFRTFWRRMFVEDVPNYAFSGECVSRGWREVALMVFRVMAWG